MSEKKKTIIAVKVDSVLVGMVDLLKSSLGYKSRASVLEEALRRMYKREFPSYGVSKPVPPTPAGAPKTAVRTTARARVQNKLAVKAEEEEAIVANGQQVCQYLGGINKNLGSSVEDMYCQIYFQRGAQLHEAMTRYYFKHMPMTFNGWSKDTKVRHYVFEIIFPDIDLTNRDEERVKRELRETMESVKLGLERGTMTTTSMSVYPLSMLLHEADKRGVDTAELRAQMEEAGYPEQLPEIVD